MGYEELEYLIHRLKSGDYDAWQYAKSLYSDSVRLIILNEIVANDLPLSLHPVILEETWERADERIGEFQYENGMPNQMFFLWLRGMALQFIEHIEQIYHDIDSRQFITMLQQPKTDVAREDFNWAWEFITKHHQPSLMRTIHAVLASRMAFSQDDVHDIWQRAYLNIQKRIHEFKPQFKGALVRWMHSHVQYEALNFHRVQLSKNYESIETVDYYLGADFEDPFDGDVARLVQMRNAYYDALVDIMMQLPEKSASTVLTLDQQRRAIKRLFDGKFEKPAEVARSLSVESPVIHNLMRVIKRRLEACDHLAEFVRDDQSSMKRTSNH